jgi:hypothetical protein
MISQIMITCMSLRFSNRTSSRKKYNISLKNTLEGGETLGDFI